MVHPTYESDIQRILTENKVRVGDPATGQGNIRIEDIRQFSLDARSEVENWINESSDNWTSSQEATFKQPIVWKAVASILVSLSIDTPDLLPVAEFWETKANEILKIYQQRNPTKVLNRTSSPLGDSSFRKDPFPRDDEDAFIRDFKV
jgi:hypothetical protein